jgi:hypothetical protein
MTAVRRARQQSSRASSRVWETSAVAVPVALAGANRRRPKCRSEDAASDHRVATTAQQRSGVTLRGVVIDRSGTWWTGTDAADLVEYLRAHQAGGYKVDDVVRAACSSCSHDEGFRVRFDADEEFAERTCAACGTQTVLLDGAEIVDDVTPQTLRCPCGGQTFDVAVGFARRDGEVRWVSVGIRCREEGTLGSPVDWKIDYSPSAHLLDGV